MYAGTRQPAGPPGRAGHAPDPGRDRRGADPGSRREGRVSRHPHQQRRHRALRRPERSCRARAAPRRQPLRHLRRDPGLPAAADPFPGSHRQQRVDDGPRPLAAHPGLRDLEGGRVQPDAVAARSAGRPGRAGARRPDRPHRHRHDPGLRHPEGLPESVARAIFDGVENGEEDIFPDPMSQSLAESWRNGAVKALERENAAFVAAEPAAA